MATEATNFDLDGNEEKTLLNWTSLQKPFKRRSRDFYSTVLVLAVLIGIVLFFIEGVMPVLVVAAVVFFVFVSTKTPPGMVEQTITTQGIVFAGQRFTWGELVVFWIEQKHGFDVVHIMTTRRWPIQLVLIGPTEPSGKVTIEEIRKVLLKYLPYEKPRETFADRVVKWFEEKMPLEG